MKTFYLPDLGEGLAEAEIREWYVKVGDEVLVDQPLVSMETAKAVVDVPSPYKGKIVELFGKAHDIIPTGSALISFVTEDGAGEAPQKKSSTVVGALEESTKKWDEGDVIVGTGAKKALGIKAMPAARVLAKQLNIDLKQVTPTGPDGLITADDVKNAIGLTRPVEAQPIKTNLTGKTEPLRGVRRVMAQAMTQSHHEIVPVTIVEDADISNLPPKTDITAKVIHAIAAAVKEEPGLNAWFDGKALERKLFTEVNVGLAVDSTEGLFVPVIRDVDKQSTMEIRDTVDNYKNAVQSRSIPATDMQGATITLSNFGTISGKYATPIIVPPSVAILGCGRSRETVIAKNGEVTVAKIMPLSLTFDHRAVTGGEATRFLAAVIRYLQN